MLADQNLAVFRLNCAILHDYSTEVDREAYEVSECFIPIRTVESVFVPIRLVKRTHKPFSCKSLRN